MKDKPTKEEQAERVPTIPVHVPMNIVRWMVYSGCFFLLLWPFFLPRGQWICGAMILGWFAGLLNAIANKK
jgi:hypothetical protein